MDNEYPKHWQVDTLDGDSTERERIVFDSAPHNDMIWAPYVVFLKRRDMKWYERVLWRWAFKRIGGGGVTELIYRKPKWLSEPVALWVRKRVYTPRPDEPVDL